MACHYVQLVRAHVCKTVSIPVNVYVATTQWHQQQSQQCTRLKVDVGQHEYHAKPTNRTSVGMLFIFFIALDLALGSYHHGRDIYYKRKSGFRQGPPSAGDATICNLLMCYNWIIFVETV